MRALYQIAAVTLLNLRSVRHRLGSSLVVVIGIAGVVTVLVSILAMATSFKHTIANTGRPDRVLVLRGGASAEGISALTRENTQTIIDTPGIKRDEDGKAIASAEALSIINVIKKSDGIGANVALRGVGSNAFKLRPEIKLIEGRLFRPAVRELIVGKAALTQFQHLQVGSHIDLRDGQWTIVGVFASGGDAHESELLADVETVISATQRNSFQSVMVMLDSPAAFMAFKQALVTNPTLSVEVLRETDYYAQQSQKITQVLFFVAYIVGGIMAVGALFSALNTMYSAVEARFQEIATLRAIGFGNAAVVISVLVEACLLALLGGAGGAALAWCAFNGNAVNALGGNFTQIVFHLAVTPALVALGVAWAGTIGLLGGLLPALRAARLPIALALRARG